MAINDLNAFLASYFQAHHCEVLENTNGVLQIQLTEKMDRALMNRPFYWHYIKKMGREGEPKQLSFITNPNKREENGEWIHFGSPRLQQILRHLKQHERYTKLFQRVDTHVNTPLYPWLVINLKVSYKGKQKKEEMFSLGLQMVTGEMRSEMMETLKTIPLQQTISDYCYTISPIIRLSSGFKRMEAVIDNYIKNQTHDWADASLAAMKEDILTLEHFYVDQMDTEKETMQREMAEIEERYRPVITYEVINGGMFYLTRL
ncbi:YqhG family protein [Oceanobacillus kapialis]|uniref:YqhG family protein n=1 Tax=Oceanobacillus kapialis TaxID=481353 RepID=A0ABW5Q5U8_9BACI